MEQLIVAKETKAEIGSALKKHEGHATRVILDALKKHGIDRQVYFSGCIVGNHCMKFGERGEAIVTAITEKMKPFYKNNKTHLKYLQNIDTVFKKNSFQVVPPYVPHESREAAYTRRNQNI